MPAEWKTPEFETYSGVVSEHTADELAADRCPGVRAPHSARDGALARVRLPGGVISAVALTELAHVASEFGDGHLELTSRANIQIRGISDVEAVSGRLTAAGLVPPTHEHARNIVASPQSGRVGGRADLREQLARLDRELQSRPVLEGLSGRFLFGLDDGRGDVLAQQPDSGALWHDRETAELIVGGVRTGRVVDSSDVVPAILAVAEEFLAAASGRWRVRDLDATEAGALITALPGTTGSSEPVLYHRVPRIGWIEQMDGAVMLGGVLAHGRLSAQLAEFLGAIGTDIVITPDREVLITDLTEGVADTVLRVLAPLGLIFDAGSPWAHVSCCVGAPGCAKSGADVRSLAAARVAELAADEDSASPREHWVGCDRGCGSPASAHILVIATADELSTVEK